MNDILELIAHPWHDILMLLGFFSLAPDIALRLLVCLYPKGSDRRKELVAELRVVPRKERPFWVTEQIALIFSEGVGDRLRGRHQRRDRKTTVQTKAEIERQIPTEPLKPGEAEAIFRRHHEVRYGRRQTPPMKPNDRPRS